MSPSFSVHPSFRSLTPSTPVMRYRLSDVFAYVSDRLADAHVNRDIIARADDRDEAFLATAGAEIMLCQDALSRLLTLEDCGEHYIHLNVTRDIVRQIARFG